MSAQEKEKEPKESKPKDTKISEIPNVKIEEKQPEKTKEEKEKEELEKRQKRKERFGNKEKEEEAKVIISTKEEIEQRKERFKDQYEIIQAEKEKKKEEDDEKEILELNNIINNLKIEIESLKSNKPQPMINRNKFLCDAYKSYVNKKLLRYKIKLLVYLILKSKYDKLMKINEKKEKVVIKQPVTPPPQSLIKITKRSTLKDISVQETPGKVSYKRRNEK